MSSANGASRAAELALHRGHVAVARLVAEPDAGQLGRLLLQRHPAEQVRDPLRGRPRRIAPGLPCRPGSQRRAAHRGGGPARPGGFPRDQLGGQLHPPAVQRPVLDELAEHLRGRAGPSRPAAGARWSAAVRPSGRPAGRRSRPTLRSCGMPQRRAAAPPRRRPAPAGRCRRRSRSACWPGRAVRRRARKPPSCWKSPCRTSARSKATPARSRAERYPSIRALLHR